MFVGLDVGFVDVLRLLGVSPRRVLEDFVFGLLCGDSDVGDVVGGVDDWVGVCGVVVFENFCRALDVVLHRLRFCGVVGGVVDLSWVLDVCRANCCSPVVVLRFVPVDLLGFVVVGGGVDEGLCLFEECCRVLDECGGGV